MIFHYKNIPTKIARLCMRILMESSSLSIKFSSNARITKKINRNDRLLLKGLGLATEINSRKPNPNLSRMIIRYKDTHFRSRPYTYRERLLYIHVGKSS